MRKPFVLIVDDEPDILLMVRAALESEGWRTALAGDGETALTRIREDHPDVVLLDIMMPMLDGWAVIDALGGERRRPGLVVLSAKARIGDMVRAYRMGADAYVTKPFEFEDLVATVLEVARRSDEERAAHRAWALRRLGERQHAPRT